MLTEVLTNVAIVVGLLLLLSIVLFVGRERLRMTLREWQSRLRISAPVILVLSVVLVCNRIMRRTNLDFGFHATSVIRSIEGESIFLFQEIATPELTSYFAFIYIYGYTFLLIFPAIAYFALSDTKTFRRLLTAYAFNYGIGLIVYALVVAYGPRNVFPGELMTVLYDYNPDYQHLTKEVNRSTNVFPSLHTSLAATVGIFAHLTRSSYSKWYPVAVLIAVSVILSTMYLAIHWMTDVVGGLILAAVSVKLSYWLVGRWSLSELVDQLRGTDRP